MEGYRKICRAYVLKKGRKPKPQQTTADSLRRACMAKRQCDFERYIRIRNKTKEAIHIAKWNFERKIAGKSKAKTETKHFWS